MKSAVKSYLIVLFVWPYCTYKGSTKTKSELGLLYR